MSRKAGTNSDPAAWDKDYLAGRWRYLREPREQARLAIAALYVHLFGPGAVLDLGCGDAQLFRHLDPRRVTAYTGVDFSAAALAGAELAAKHATLITGSVEDFAPPPDIRYDSILFNEVLYYLPDDPLAQLRRYTAFLQPPGALIVSVPRARLEGGSWDGEMDALWKRIKEGPWQILDEVFLAHDASRNSWRICALRPLAAC